MRHTIEAMRKWASLLIGENNRLGEILNDYADEWAAEVEQLKAELGNIVNVIEAHDIDTLDCDNAGEKYCDCLYKAINKARKLIKNEEPIRDATEEETAEWYALIDNAKPGDTLVIPGRLLNIAIPYRINCGGEIRWVTKKE